MRKKIICIILIILIVAMPQVNLAIDDDDIDYIWLQEEITAAKETDEPKVYSKAAVVFDRGSKTILYGKNENEKLAMASTTKIMTAILLVENRDLSEEVEVVKEAAAVGGSSLELKTGDKLTYEALLYGLMLCSGNDAAAQIAISIAGSIEEFADLMNAKAESLGLENTHFITPHGLDKEGHYTTAYELAQIADYALKFPKIAEVVATKTYTILINGYPRTLTNTNELLGYLEGVNGVKTGFTGNAGRCLVTSCTRDGFNIITVVLGADTKKIRTKDSINLIEYTYRNFEQIDLEGIVQEEFSKWRDLNLSKINIKKGIENKVGVKLGEVKYKKYPVKKENKDKIEVKSNIGDLNLEALVKKGHILGSIEVKIADELIMNVEISTAKEVRRKGIIDYMKYFGSFLGTPSKKDHIFGGFGEPRR